MKIRGNYPGEVAAIRRIRKANPTIGAKTLAKGILSGTYKDHGTCTPVAPSRTVLSTYSVIRRYDADIVKGKTPALAA